MTLGALVDLGLDSAWFEAELRRLPLEGFALASQTVHVSGIRATRLSVYVDQNPPIATGATSGPWRRRWKPGTVPWAGDGEADRRSGGQRPPGPRIRGLPAYR